MTREEAKEMLPIIQAYADGKTILIKHEGEWLDACRDTDVYFSESPSDYCIKPEPKYRPFRTQEECWNEMHKHPDFGWLKNKFDGALTHISSVSEQKDKSILTCATCDNFRILPSGAFDIFTFTDGTPFGIKEE